jgi:cytochrome c oxidase subunit 3
MSVSTAAAVEPVEASVFGASWRKVMMWLFIVSDALLFAGFLAAYGFRRIASSSWPDTAEVFNLKYISAMTFVLITSSATMATAVGWARAGRIAARWVAATIAGGLAFLGMQAYEWAHMIHEGARLTRNPWGDPAFSAFFFVITGFHGTHVLLGVFILTVVAIRARLGRLTAEGIELAGLYWHFVDLVWVFIFTLFYLV